jgi:hypothetical protein
MKKRIITSLLALGLVFNGAAGANALSRNGLYSTAPASDGGGTSCSHYYVTKTFSSGDYRHPIMTSITACEFCGKIK